MEFKNADRKLLASQEFDCVIFPPLSSFTESISSTGKRPS